MMGDKTKHLVRVGHEFAAAMSDDTPIITIAKMVTELASALDVQSARSDALAAKLNDVCAENAALKHAMAVTMEHVSVMDTGQAGVAAMIINDSLHNSETPSTDAWVNEQRAVGVEMLAAEYESKIEPYKNHDEFMNAHYLKMQAIEARNFAAQLRGGQV